MDRRHFLIQSATTLAAQTRRPNILFLLASQWRAQCLPSANDLDMQAPHLARLANEGVHFERAYASYPLSSPSRAALLTGKFPHACRVSKNDVQLPLDEPSIAAVLKAAGYATGFIGKWHLDGADSPGFVPPGPRRRGFDYWAAFNNGHRYFDATYFRDDDKPLRSDVFEPDYQTDLAIDFIRRNKQNPFHLFLSWGPPHPPRIAPESTAKLYNRWRFTLRENISDGYETKNIAGYYGLCSALDACVGKLMRTLDELQLAEDTIVVFTSDQGDMLGSHGLENGNEFYEESAHIPLLVRYPPRIKAGSRNDALLSNVDYMPTLLAMSGAAIPEGVQGRNLAGQWTGAKSERPESIFAEGKIGVPGEWRMMIRGFDKVVTDRRGEITHHFNLEQDPFETTNHAGRVPARRRDELLALIRLWRKQLNDGISGSGLQSR